MVSSTDSLRVDSISCDYRQRSSGNEMVKNNPGMEVHTRARGPKHTHAHALSSDGTLFSFILPILYTIKFTYFFNFQFID